MVLLAAAVAATGLLVGGLSQVPRQSHTFEAALNRSLAAQGSVLAGESNATSAELRGLMADMQNEDRSTLQSGLDSLVRQSADAARASQAAGSSAPSSVAADLASVFADRAQAVSMVRAALDGLLGMHPLPVADAASVNGTGASTPTLLSSSGATDRIAAAGTLLARSDQLYQAVRRTLRAAGHARLPPSAWITDAELWQAGAVATQVDLVASSTTLSATHYLVLRTVRLSPPALPTSSASPGGASVLTPTTEVSVNVVLSDLGTVDEPHAEVQISLARQPSGSPVTQSRSASVVSGSSVTLPAVNFAVSPGQSYLLSVSVVLPVAQTTGVGTSLQKVLQIAPGT